MNFKKFFITNIFGLLLTISLYGQQMSQQARFGSIQGNPQDQSNLVIYVNQVTTNSIGTLSNDLASTTSGAEGIRLIGALGGYNLEEFIEDTALRGPARDYTSFTYELAPITNLTITYNGGDIYSPVDGYFHLITNTLTLTDNANNYIYWNSGLPTQLQKTTVRPTVDSNIVVATFVTAFGMIMEYDSPEASGNFPLNTRAGAARIAPSLVVEGLNYYAVSTNLNAIVMDPGLEYHDMRVPKVHKIQDLRDTNITVGITTFGHTNVGYWGYSSTNQFPIGLWDDGTNVIACDAGSWYKGAFLSLPNSTVMYYVYPQVSYTSETAAIEGYDLSLPPGFTPYIPLCTEYVFKGDDTALRTEGTYWVDRRFQIRRPSATGGGTGGGTAPTPSLTQVMIAGSSLGGILPHDAGLPTDLDQLTSKEYVDSTINNVNAHRAYVDSNGSNLTAQLESSIRPFKTIQAAIDAAAAVATDDQHFIVTVSPGRYIENISMSNHVGVLGSDIEATIINGTVTYSSNYIDENGSELQQVTVNSTNIPALIINTGIDLAYVGIRSCFLTTTYDNGQSNKTVIQINRGLSEIYGTTYCELYISPTNGSGEIRNAQIFEHTTDLSNEGLSQLASFSSSCHIFSSDTNDDISLMYTHDNTDTKCINTLQGTLFNIYLDQTNGVYTNNIKMVSHKVASGRTLSMGTVNRIYTHPTNSINIFFGYATEGVSENVAIVRGNHTRIIGSATSNIWLGAATGTNDAFRCYDSVYINNLPDYPYPQVYTNAGALGKFFYNTPAENGDYIFGGSLDMSAGNTVSQTLPSTGHVKIYAGVYAGLENPYFRDSSGNISRMSRDNFYNGYNADTSTLQVGEAVYISSGISSDNTPKVKRSIASDPSTMPAIGLVSQVGGIATGSIGRIMIMGRLESYVDTSAFTSGDKLYVRSDLAGGITNVTPTGDNIAQIIGTCHISSTNGYINVRPWQAGTFGGLTPNKYITNNQTTVTFGNVIANGSSVTNVDAVTLAGYTYEQLAAQQLTYYIWGSITGPYTNDITPSRMAQLESPVGLDPRTNSYLNVTNGQFLGGISVNTNQNPRVLTKGVVTINNVLSTTSTNHPRIRGTLFIYESDQTTVVASFPNGEIIAMQDGTEIPTSYSLDISITNDVSIADYGRIMLFRTRLVDGWTGTETIKAFSQDGYLSRVTLPGSGGGVYVTSSDYNIDRILWVYAYNWVSNNQNGVSYLFSRSNAYDQAVIDSSNATNYMANSTNVWDGRYLGKLSNAVSASYASVANLATNAQISTNSYQLGGLPASVYVTNTTPIRFKAGLQANITLPTGTSKFALTNVLLSASGGSYYDATNSRWYPNTTNKIIEFKGGIRVDTVQNGIVHGITLYKNGNEYSRLFSYRSANAADSFNQTWDFIETINTSTNDFYEIYTISGNASTTVGISTNNWWFGEAKN